VLKIEGLVEVFDREGIKVCKVVSEITGDNDFIFKAELEKELFSMGDLLNDKVIIDFLECSYINSKGIGVLASVFNKLKSQGGELVLTSLSSIVQRIFYITKLDKVFIIKDSIDAGIEFFKENHDKKRKD
jgi:anti-sigma B factor antagonist